MDLLKEIFELNTPFLNPLIGFPSNAKPQQFQVNRQQRKLNPRREENLPSKISQKETQEEKVSFVKNEDVQSNITIKSKPKNKKKNPKTKSKATQIGNDLVKQKEKVITIEPLKIENNVIPEINSTEKLPIVENSIVSTSSLPSVSVPPETIEANNKGSPNLKNSPSSNNSSSVGSDKRLFQAIMTGKFSNVKHILNEQNVPSLKELTVIQIKAKTVPYNGWSVLHCAAWKGTTELTQLLISHGADVNFVNQHGQSPLHIASLRGQDEVAACLLKNGAFVDAKNSLRGNQTPLHIASLKGFLNIVRILLQNGAAVNFLNENTEGPQSALQLAIKRNHISVVEELIKAGANVDQVENGFSALDLSIINQNSAIINLLSKKVNYTIDSLVFAVKQKDIDTTKLLLSKVDPTNHNSKGETPLHIAASNGSLDLVEFLLSNFDKKQIDKRNYNNESPLYLAVKNNHFEIAKTLLNYGASANQLNISIYEPILSIAVQVGSIELTNLLLEKGAQINLTNSSGQNALHAAVLAEKPEILKVLVKRATIKEINSENNACYTPLTLAVLNGNIEILEILVKAKADINVRNSKRMGFTPLHIAAFEGQLNAVKFLVQNGADIHAKKMSKGGAQTAVEIASEKQYLEIVQYLVQNGAQMKQKPDSSKPLGHKIQLCTFNDTIPSEFHYDSKFSLQVKESVNVSYDYKANPLENPNSSLSSAGTFQRPWKTVRLFLSSTFVDMFSEREYLVKNVIPKLKEKCATRRIHLVEVDLRWGITEEESKSGKALQICLEEVEECHIFCNILGNRYGWIPEDNQIPADVKIKFGWQKGFSITAMEVYQGALKKKKDPNCHAFFYFRDSTNFSSSVPSNLKNLYFDEEKLLVQKMETLKKEIKESGFPVFNYKPSYKSLDKDKLILSSLEAFGEDFFQKVWKQIDHDHPSDEIPPDELTLERTYHEEFMETRLKNFVGRTAQINAMTKYVKNPSQQTPLVVIGVPGAGKSALMGHFAKKCVSEERDYFVLVHFIGGSPKSTRIRDTLWRFCSELKREFILDVEIPIEYEELSSLFSQLLHQIADQGKKNLIVIDALNQLDGSNRSHSLEWLPSTLPKGIKIVISCLKGDCLDILQGRRTPSILVDALSIEDRKDIVSQTLAMYNKKLDSNQMDALMKKEDTTSPLFLVVCCEQLRLFGIFEQLKKEIDSLPGHVPELFDYVLGKLEEEHGKALVSSALSLLECSRHGLLEVEMLELLNLNSSVWSSLFLNLKFFLRPVGKNGEGQLDFFHRQLAKAVRRRYLNNPNEEQKYQRQLADYYWSKINAPSNKAEKFSDYTRGISALPFHLISSHSFQDAQNILTNIYFVEKKCEHRLAYELISDYAFFFEKTQEARFSASSSISEFQKFVLENIYILSNFPQLTLQQASIHSIPLISAQELSNLNRPVIYWENNTSSKSVSSLLNITAGAEVNDCQFSPDFTSKFLLSGHKDGSLKLWNSFTGEEIFTLSEPNSNRITNCCFSKNGKWIAASTGNSIKLWDGTTYQFQKSLEGHTNEVLTCSFSPDSMLLISGSEDATCKLWNINTGKLLHSFSNEGAVLCTRFSSDGRKAVIAFSKSLLVWDTEKKSIIYTFVAHQKLIKDCIWVNDKIISCSNDKSIKVWNSSTQTLLATFSEHSDNVSSCAVSQNGKYLVTVSWDKSLIIWDLEKKTEVYILHAVHSHFLSCVRFSSDEQKLITGSVDMSMKIFNWNHLLAAETSTGSESHHSKMIRGLDYYFDKTNNVGVLVSGSWDKLSKLFSPSGQEIKKLTSHSKRINCCRFTPNGGKAVLTGSLDNTLKLTSVENSQTLLNLEGHTTNVFACDISHDGQYAVSGSSDGSIRIWSLETGESLGVLEGHQDWVTAICFSPYSRRIISGSKDHTLKIWNSETGEELETLHGHTNTILCVRYSPDGKYIVSCAEDRTIKVWDAFSHKEIRTIQGHTHEVTSFDFLGDKNQYIVSGSSDKTVRIFELETGKLVWLFFCSGAILSLISMPPNKIACGDSVGKLYILRATEINHLASSSSTPNSLPSSSANEAMAKFDIRVGRIKKCSLHPSADKLYVEQVDIGESQPRQIISGVAQYIPLSEMQNRLVVVLANIKPSTLRGLTSEGMLFGVVDPVTKNVELLDPPPKSKEGERVLIQGVSSPSIPTNELDYFKEFSTVEKDLLTNSEKIATFKNIPLMTSAGPIKVKSIVGGRVG